MLNLGKTISAILYQKGWTQKQLAQKAHITDATISRYITEADRMPRADLIVSLAKALDVSSDYLLGLTTLPSNQPLSPEIEDLISCYTRASEADRKVVWALLDRYRIAEAKYRIAASGQDEWDGSDSQARQDAVKKFEDR